MGGGDIMSVEFLVKLRDAAQMIADAANDYLEKESPVNDRDKTEDLEKLEWTEIEGTKSPYQQTTKEANKDNEIFRALQQTLKEHKGFWQNSVHKYWNHQGAVDIIDRRKR